MSIYNCNECQGQFDSDFVGCNFDPRSEYDLICDDCDICVFLRKFHSLDREL